MVVRSKQKTKVLIVDDDSVSAQVHAAALSAAGYLVEVRDVAFGTLPHILRFKPDVALLDLMMPGLGGSELAELIATREAQGRPAIVFLSALPSVEINRQVQTHGALGGIEKSGSLVSFISTFQGLTQRVGSP